MYLFRELGIQPMADVYSYPEVLDLSYDQIEALDITYVEKQNIRLRKLANRDYSASQRRELVNAMVELFTKPGSQPKSARDSVSRWLSPNPGKVRRDFYTAQGSGATFPATYNATEKYQTGAKAGVGIPGRIHEKDTELSLKERMVLRDRFIKGMTQQVPIKAATKVERSFGGGGDGVQKDRIIQYLRTDSLWSKDLKLKMSIRSSDLGFQIEFDDYSGESESAEGLSAELLDGIYED
jgi:hypothetical protein